MSNNNIGSIICETAAAESSNSKILNVDSGRVITVACLQDVGIINRNKRYYSAKELVEKGFKRERFRELLKTRNLFGEAGHPISKDIGRQQDIKLDNTSHLILEVWVEGNKVMGKLKADDSPMGDKYHKNILSGTIPSYSLRALGMLENVNGRAEVKNINIITWDWVIYPSHKVAYQKEILHNGRDNKTSNISESANLEIVTENSLYLKENDSGLVTPINQNDVVTYIKDKSDNFKRIEEGYDIVFGKAKLDKYGKHLYIPTLEGHTIAIRIDDYLEDEIMNFASKLK